MNATNSLLAQKGKAKPAMRRQNTPASRGFGEGAGLGGFLMGGESEDLGWNDMGEPPVPETPETRAIGLTPFSGEPESLYVEGTGSADPDWDEADAYDDDEDDGAPAMPDASAQWREQAVAPTPAGNPVGRMQERLHAATVARAAPEQVFERITVEVPASQPVNIFDRLSATIARLFAALTGRADRLLVLRLDRDDCKRLHAAAQARGCDEGEIVAAAIDSFLSPHAATEK